MNAHFRLGLGLFLALAVLAGCAGWGMQAIHRPIAQELSLALEQTDRTQALAHLQQANRRWERFRPLICTLADHTPMEEIDRLFAEAESGASDPGVFVPCCAQLRLLVAGMAQAHAFTWWNIL